jgi:hypothetical protein
VENQVSRRVNGEAALKAISKSEDVIFDRMSKCHLFVTREYNSMNECFLSGMDNNENNMKEIRDQFSRAENYKRNINSSSSGPVIDTIITLFRDLLISIDFKLTKVNDAIIDSELHFARYFYETAELSEPHRKYICLLTTTIIHLFKYFLICSEYNSHTANITESIASLETARNTVSELCAELTIICFIFPMILYRLKR